MPSIATPVAFAPTAPVLDAILDELDDLGSNGGGAVTLAARRAALASYATLVRAKRDDPPRWRHGDAAARFEDLIWTSGRMAVPAGRGTAAGLVHAGSVHLAAAVAPVGGVAMLTLADALRTRPAQLAPIYGRLVGPDADVFTALATAFQNCGAYVDIEPNATLDAPVQIVWTASLGEAAAVFPQTVIRVGAGARATIIERHLGETDSFVAGTVEIDLAEGAHLDYVVVSQIDGGVRTAIHRAARCARGATIRWHLAELGGALARSSIASKLEGAGSSAHANVLFFARGFEHVDATVDVDQAAAETASRTVVRAGASGRGQVRFGGTVRVRRGASGSRASFRQDGIVLSRDAYVDGRPTLAVEAHDVFVSHGASIGGLDEDELFYVQSRGIARSAAERMIALAFFEPAIVNFPSQALREEIRTALDEELDEIADTFAS